MGVDMEVGYLFVGWCWHGDSIAWGKRWLNLCVDEFDDRHSHCRDLRMGAKAITPCHSVICIRAEWQGVYRLIRRSPGLSTYIGEMCPCGSLALGITRSGGVPTPPRQRPR